MNKRFWVVVVAVIGLVAGYAGAGQRYENRNQIPAEYRWRLEDLYPSDQAWRQAKNQLASRLNEVQQYRGQLGTSAGRLLACLDFTSGISKEFARLDGYASMKSDEDTRNAAYVAMREEIGHLGTEYGSKASFIEPEIAKMSKEQIDRFLADEPKLKVYKMMLQDILRRKEHTLSEAEEKILAESRLMAEAPSSIYTILSNAETPYPEIRLSDGNSVRLDKAGFARYRAAVNRQDREAVFGAFWKALREFEGTFGADLYGEVKKDMFYARARKYPSSLHRSLDEYNIPVEVYQALVNNVRANLDTFQRYLTLKRRMLGVETLKYSDIYAPTVEGVNLQYSFEQAEKLVLDALQPLGADYVGVVRKALDERWIDVYPTPGKKAGAYSEGAAYDVHPYILLNYNGQYDDVSTLAHELGHTMQSYYSNTHQPYPTAGYATFVAEVASTFNEALLMQRMLREIQDDKTRLSLLMSYLDGVKGTLFRQTLFSEFELQIHQKAERGEPLTGKILSEMYGGILKAYYGHDKGVCKIDDVDAIEWAYVPHFYMNFYVYQYATSFTAATALSELVLRKEPGAVEKYIAFLSAGGSDYPIELLKEAGVDMTTAEPFQKTMTAMNRAMDQIEQILEKRKPVVK